VEHQRFTTWIESLAARSGAADGTVRTALPAEVRIHACIDRAHEVAVLGAALRGWRLGGIAAERIAVVSGRLETAHALLAASGAADPTLRVAELGGPAGLGDRPVDALALVGCDHGFFGQDADSFGAGEAMSPREQGFLVLRACAAPRDRLLITWRGRPESLFAPLAAAG
jgi:hypothetical protein